MENSLGNSDRVIEILNKRTVLLGDVLRPLYHRSSAGANAVRAWSHHSALVALAFRAVDLGMSLDELEQLLCDVDQAIADRDEWMNTP